MDDEFKQKLLEKMLLRGWGYEDFGRMTEIPMHNIYSWCSDPPRRTPPCYVQNLIFSQMDRVGLP